MLSRTEARRSTAHGTNKGDQVHVTGDKHAEQVWGQGWNAQVL